MSISALLVYFAMTQSGQPGQNLDFSSTPSTVPTRGRARFVAQTAEPLNGGNRLTVRIIAPDDVVEQIVVQPDKNGKFTLDYVPKMNGRFKVVFVGYDGNTVLDNRSFEVTPWNVAADRISLRSQSIQRNISTICDSIQTDLERRPSGPDRNAALEKARKLKEQIRRLGTATASAMSAANRVQTLASGAPPEALEECAEMLSQLSDWENEAQDEDARLQEIANRIRTMPSSCDQLEVAGEGLQFISNVMIFVTSPVKILVNIGLEKVLPAIDSAAGVPENVKFTGSEMRKELVAAADGLPGLIGSLVGLTGDVAAFVIQKVFASMCRVIEGPVSATFSVDAKHQGKSYWKYTVELEGKLRLWSEKSAPVTAKGAEFSGRLEGNFKKIDFAEEIFVIEKYPVGGKMLVRKKIVPPVITPTMNEQIGLGQVMRAALPGYFNARYLAYLKEDKLDVKQESVVLDVSNKYQNRLAIAFVPADSVLPVFRIFDFPIQKGCWIFDRASKGPFEIAPTRVGEATAYKKTFTRDEVTGNGNISVKFRASYDLK